MLDALQAPLIALLGPMGPVMALGLLGLGMVLAVVPVMLKPRKDPLERLTTPKATTAPDKSTAKSPERLRMDSGTDKLQKYSTFLEPQDEKEYSAVRLKLVQAGYRSRNAVRIYHFAQFALGLGLLGLGGLYAFMQAQQGNSSTQTLIMSLLIPGAIGYMAPKYWVTRRQAERREAITYGFPDSLDLMLVCVEAGQSLDQSILRVAREMRTGFPDLAEEYEIVSYELKAGKDKVSVLRDMGERCGVPDINSFVTVLIQSQQFGTSIAEALRIYAAEMRDKRVMRAEEKANTLPTKMTLATMMLTVPPLMIILIGPSLWDIYLLIGNGLK